MIPPRCFKGLFLCFLVIAFPAAGLDLDWDEKGDFPSLSFPSFPAPPRASGPAAGAGSSQKAVVTETHALQVTEALLNGDPRNNAASNIDHSDYRVYSDGSRELRVSFKNSPPYIYYFQNPRSPLQTGPGIFRTEYNVIIQTGTEFLFESYTAEIYSGGENTGVPSSIAIFGGDRAVVVLNFKAAPRQDTDESGKK